MNGGKNIVTVAICTYNRSVFLDKCLNSLFKFHAEENPLEIMVIDNNSTDNTRIIVKKHQLKHSNITYYIETKVGLSHARNRAITESNTEYIVYLDDDAVISESYLERMFWIIDNYKFACFGGMYYPIYLHDKPKWIPDDYGKKEKLLDEIGILEEGFVPGSVMGFKRKKLIDVGGFPAEFGMIGNQIGYGEDDWVQKKIRERGGGILFDPELFVYHYVQEYKHSLKWQLKSMYISAKSGFLINRQVKSITKLVLILLKAIIALVIKRIPMGVYKLIFKKKYYYQNFILESLKPTIVTIAKINVFYSLK